MQGKDRIFKLSLKKVFVLAATFVAGAGCARTVLPTAPEDAEPVPFTAGETEMAHDLFADQIYPDIVKKYFVETDPENPRRAAAVHGPMIMLIHGEEHYSEDYSQETNVFKYGLFAHELTHLWQRQNDTVDRRITNGECKTYPYELFENSDFTSFCIEQQAAIIEDYARRFLLVNPGYSRHYENKPEFYDTAETDELLAKVVEEFFPHVRSARFEVALERSTQGLDVYSLHQVLPYPQYDIIY